MSEIAVIQTGVANVASMLACLRRAGAEPYLTASPRDAERAAGVVLPGVGSFAAGMAALRRHGLCDVLRERIEAGQPTLAVCLGLQFLGSGSEEAPGEPGLGVLPEVARRFPAEVRVPQLGWNRVEPGAACNLLRPGFAYFANSYRLLAAPAGWAATTTPYGGPFVSALEKGNVLACQFHPELSGRWGQELVSRWLAPATKEKPC